MGTLHLSGVWYRRGVLHVRMGTGALVGRGADSYGGAMLRGIVALVMFGIALLVLELMLTGGKKS